MPSARTITLCYEIVQQYYDQYTGDIRNGIDPEEVDIAEINAAAAGDDGANDGEDDAADEAAEASSDEDASTEIAEPAGSGFSIRSTWAKPGVSSVDASEKSP